MNGATLNASHLQVQRFNANGLHVHGAQAKLTLDFGTLGTTTTLFTGDDATKEAVAVQIDADAANGQSSITLAGDRATGETYTLAHHLLAAEEGRTLLVMSIRYEDSFVKRDGRWRFARRTIYADAVGRIDLHSVSVAASLRPAR